MLTPGRTLNDSLTREGPLGLTASRGHSTMSGDILAFEGASPGMLPGRSAENGPTEAVRGAGGSRGCAALEGASVRGSIRNTRAHTQQQGAFLPEPDTRSLGEVPPHTGHDQAVCTPRRPPHDPPHPRGLSDSPRELAHTLPLGQK